MSKIANRLINVYKPIKSGSIRFDGTQKCKVDSPILIGTSQDFTIEAFVYRTANNSIYDGIFSIRGFGVDWNAGPGQGLVMACGNMHVGDFGSVTFSQSVPLNTWTHIAISRNGTALNAYINGVKVGAATSSSALGLSGYYPIIGAFDQAGGSDRYNLVGSITNLRVCVGTGLYPAAFTPPSTKLSLITNTKFLLPANSAGNFLQDTSGFNTLTNYGATYNPATPF